MSAPPHAVLDAAWDYVGMSFRDLWISYFSLGGLSRPEAVRDYLAGRTAHVVDYDVLAQAINERFMDSGGNHPVPYLEDFS